MKIPVTALREFYRILSLYSIKTNISILDDYNRGNNYLKLVELFYKSKKQFEIYHNTESFISNSRRKALPVAPTKISNTNDVVSLLEQNKVNIVVNNKSLNFRYIEREISPLRTTGNSMFLTGESSKKSGTGGLDFIALNEKDNLPILGEIKVKNDKNHFYAIIQLLTYLSEMSTPNQIDRINATGLYDNIRLDTDKFYLYIISSQYNMRSKPRQKILSNSNELAEKLKNGINEIKDIVFLEFNEPGGKIEQNNEL